MEKFLGSYSPQIYAIMRIVVGLLFFCHGLQKLFGLFGGVNGAAVPLMSSMGLAGVIEVLCGLLVAVGLVTGYAAFIASGEMAVAYFMAHFPMGLWPIENQGELAVLYCFIFLYIATQGSGVWGVDGSQRGRSRLR
ncbi:MAG: DoxX family protein [Candidatus Binatia bacterium]